MASPPFRGVNVFLHIRDHGDSGTDRTRHYAKKAIRKLGAILTLSEATADLVVFHCGSTSLLENMTAHGKIVVSPLYLTECANRMERLPVDNFLIHPPINGGEAEDSHKPNKKQNGPRTSCASNERRVMSAGVSKTSNPTLNSTTASPSPVLLSIPSTNTTNTSRTEGVSVVTSAGDKVRSHEKTSVQILDDVEDEAPRSIRDGKRTETPRVVLDRKRPYLLDDEDETPVVSMPTAMNSGEKTSNGGTATNTQRKRPRQTNDTGKERFHSNENGEKGEGQGRSPPGMRSADTRGLSPMFLQQSDRQQKRQRRKRRDAHEQLSGAVPLRIAVSSEETETVQFLLDVIEQLGATAVPCVFGRVQKPTHLVVAGRGELTPMVLMARALGIPVLVEQWLHDAIALGTFPNIIDAHIHPHYGQVQCHSDDHGDSNEKSIESDKVVRDANKSMSRIDTSDRGSRARKNVEDVLAHILDDDIGPHYRPIFFGMTFAFARCRSIHAHAEYFAELLRLLGAVVSRSAASTQLTAIIDIGEDEGTGEAPESQALVLTYPSGRGAQSRAKSKKKMTETLGETAVPVVSVEWVVQCILLGKVTDMDPFEVTSDESVISEAVNDNTNAAVKDTGSMYTNNGKNSSVTRPPVASVLAKTREGPNSAKKKAEHQVTTQQLLEE